MTRKPKKAKRKRVRPRPGRVGRLWASVDDDLISLADQEAGAEARWNRPRKQQFTMRVDVEVVEWLRSKGPGYQTRINRILRRVMMESRKRAGQR